MTKARWSIAFMFIVALFVLVMCTQPATSTPPIDEMGLPRAQGGSCSTYSNSTTITIPDGDSTGITSTITIPPVAGIVTYVRVSIGIDHAYPGDLSAYLTTPNLCMSEIFAGDMGSDAFAGSLYFANDGAMYIYDDSVPFSNLYRPNAEFSSNFRAGGRWTLNISDNAGADEGTLTGWSVTLCTGSARPSDGPATATPTITPTPTTTPIGTVTPIPFSACVSIYEVDTGFDNNSPGDLERCPSTPPAGDGASSGYHLYQQVAPPNWANHAICAYTKYPYNIQVSLGPSESYEWGGGNGYLSGGFWLPEPYIDPYVGPVSESTNGTYVTCGEGNSYRSGIWHKNTQSQITGWYGSPGVIASQGLAWQEKVDECVGGGGAYIDETITILACEMPAPTATPTPRLPICGTPRPGGGWGIF
jgi:subtilisin-like proprotein convertase family protein